MAPWEKFAISGATYARALENAAVRTGHNVGPEVFNAVRSMPKARFNTDLSSFVRHPGALPPTKMQEFAHSMPWAGAEHTTDAMSAKAPARFDRLLTQRGMVSNTPAGRPDTHSQITKQFGTPDAFMNAQHAGDPTQTGVMQPPGTAVAAPKARRAATPLPVPNAASMAATQPMAASPYANTHVQGAPPAMPPRRFPRAGFETGKAAALRRYGIVDDSY